MASLPLGVGQHVPTLVFREYRGQVCQVAHSAWLVNVVLVIKNEKGKWRVYVDCTDINKGCLKDPYPVPRID